MIKQYVVPMLLLLVLVVLLVGVAGVAAHYGVGTRSKAYAESLNGTQTAQLLREIFGRQRDGKRRGGQTRGEDPTKDVQTRTLNVGSRNRTYYLYVPRQAAGRSAPLILAFHGGGGQAAPFARRIGLQQMADRHGYVVAAPEGIKKSWNDGSTDSSDRGVDDLAFVEAIINDVSRVTPINAARVYAMGLSRGGMMAYHAACELPGRFAAIAAVASTMSSKTCSAPKGVSLLHIHGTADENVPWEGGRGTMTARGNVWPPVEHGITMWARGNQCPVMKAPRQIAPDTTCHSAVCGTGESLEVCRIQGGGHAWPGIEPTKRQKNSDTYVSQHFDATEYIAAFFNRN